MVTGSLQNRQESYICLQRYLGQHCFLISICAFSNTDIFQISKFRQVPNQILQIFRISREYRSIFQSLEYRISGTGTCRKDPSPPGQVCSGVCVCETAPVIEIFCRDVESGTCLQLVIGLYLQNVADSHLSLRKW